VVDIKGKKVCIVGAAKSGIAAANLAVRLGATAAVTDGKSLADIESTLGGLSDRGRALVETGGHTRAFVQACDLVVVSPGVWRDAEPLRWAREAGIPVLGEIEFAWRFCRKPVAAVTGSNGKTTTVTLISKVLESGGKRVCLCGNIGTPFSERVLDEDIDIFVIEVSSFQLELVETFRPMVALITNFSQNHLDRHPTMQDYFEAKQRIFMNQTEHDFALINARDEWSAKLAGFKAGTAAFNRGLDGLNANQSAAFEVGRIFGVPEDRMHGVFAAFPVVEHRLEPVRVLDGVEYINDSKSTTVESGRWALTTIEAPVILICGGHDKGMDYAPLRDLVRAKVRWLIVLTREDKARAILHQAFEGVVPIEDHDDMTAAVHSARGQARPGDKVLLSPMFASFDMFTNFEQRGRVFKQIVRDLP
jgi:UDP-N-acetylmuramoylalanine--D-glutamate ligase